jgi:eukaryotic-like serine/threonine-protein kinase
MTTLAGRYVLAEPLGSGGMARVLLATDELLHRRVAVKLLRADLAADPIIRERLVREARSAASFSHPNAVAVFDAGEDDGIPFIVMELVEGPTLADRLRTGPIPLGEALSIADDVLAALEAAHDRGLVHRDVKPANVLLPDGGGAKLADFGIAKGVREAAGGLTATGQVLGTPKYLSPEQVAGEPASPRSDLYAVGVLCYEMLAGVPPFTGTSPLAIAMAHQVDVPAPLDTHRSDLPEHVVTTVHRALEKAPEDRFASASALRAALSGLDPAIGAGTTQVLPAPLPAGSPDSADLAATRGTDVQPVGAGHAATGSPRVLGGPVLALLALVAVLVAAGWLLSRADDAAEEGLLADPTPTAAPEGEPVIGGAAEAPPDPPPVEAPPAEPTAEPVPEEPDDSIAALLGDLAMDPDAAGEKGKDLRDKLLDLLDDDEEDQPKEARKLIAEAEKWAREGELDPAVAARTATLLAPLAGRDDDRGRGDDEDRDDD